jgi:hypothetical protein
MKDGVELDEIFLKILEVLRAFSWKHRNLFFPESPGGGGDTRGTARRGCACEKREQNPFLAGGLRRHGEKT